MSSLNVSISEVSSRWFLQLWWNQHVLCWNSRVSPLLPTASPPLNLTPRLLLTFSSNIRKAAAFCGCFTQLTRITKLLLVSVLNQQLQKLLSPTQIPDPAAWCYLEPDWPALVVVLTLFTDVSLKLCPSLPPTPSIQMFLNPALTAKKKKKKKRLRVGLPQYKHSQTTLLL